MHTTQKQRDAVLNLFSFVEEVSGVRRAVTKNISSLDWKLGLAEIDATLPGIQALHPNTKDPSLILSIVKLDVPSCPKLPEELLDVVIGNWLSPDWKVAWREPFASLTLQTDVDIREGDSEETIAEKRALQALRPFVPVRIKWLEERTKWLEERKVVVKSNELFDRFMTLRSKVAESNLRSEAVFGNFMFTSDPRGVCNFSCPGQVYRWGGAIRPSSFFEARQFSIRAKRSLALGNCEGCQALVELRKAQGVSRQA